MNNVVKAYRILYGLALFATVSVLYWSARYHLAPSGSLRHELLVGEALVILYTSPVWLGLIAIAVFGFKHLSKIQKVMAFLPAAVIFMPMIIRFFGVGS